MKRRAFLGSLAGAAILPTASQGQMPPGRRGVADAGSAVPGAAVPDRVIQDHPRPDPLSHAPSGESLAEPWLGEVGTGNLDVANRVTADGRPGGMRPAPRGINITGWFRFPASRDPAMLRRWISDAALGDLRRAGFSFVRLAVDPALLEDRATTAAFLSAMRQLHAAGLAVIVSPHPSGWHLETNAADKARLRRFWTDLAPALRPLNPALTWPEVLNEPVFPGDPVGWQTLQRAIMTDIRKALPGNTMVLTGHDWGSIGGLLALMPERDTNVVYSIHFYDPAEMTSLAAYRPGLDRAALARLPFPDDGTPDCVRIAEQSMDPDTRGLMQFHCALHWDERRVREAIGRAALWAEQHRTKLLMGEFGASVQLNRSARLAWLRTVRQACDAYGIPWALWGYDDIMGFAITRPPPARPLLDREVLAALGLNAPA